MRTCEDCTLCCTLLGVRELDKPPVQHCKHCEVNVKCNIYNTRPKECKDFNCWWLSGAVPEDLKPNSSHVVLSDLQTDLGVEIEGQVIIVYTDPNYPDAYKTGKMKDFLNALLQIGIELVIVKDGKKHFMKWGKVEDDIVEVTE